MIIDKPSADLIPALRRLWQQAFGDTDAFLDGFFSAGFSPERCRCVLEENTPLAALYWFDCTWQGKKLAYIYAVATEEQCRGYGLCRILIENTHLYLKLQGYSGAVLVPGTPDLGDMYRKFGYEPFCYTEKVTILPEAPAAYLTEIPASRFDTLRRQYLPENGILQEQETSAFLSTFCKFYTGENFLFSGSLEKDTLHIQEFLGNKESIPGILTALRASKAVVRLPGGNQTFAMYRSLTDSQETPAYFGIALD